MQALSKYDFFLCTSGVKVLFQVPDWNSVKKSIFGNGSSPQVYSNCTILVILILAGKIF